MSVIPPASRISKTGTPLGHERALVVDGPQRHARDAKRDQGRRVAMNDGLDVAAGSIDLAVDEALAVRRAAACVDGIARRGRTR